MLKGRIYKLFTLDNQIMKKRSKKRVTKKHILTTFIVVIILILAYGLFKIGPFASEKDVGPQTFQFDEEKSIVCKYRNLVNKSN